jgi:hypothetical protein
MKSAVGPRAVHAGEKIRGEAPVCAPAPRTRCAFRAVDRSVFGPTCIYKLCLIDLLHLYGNKGSVHIMMSRLSRLQVRLYTAKKIQQQLEAARTEFIRGSVAVRKQALLLPKVLHCYARDAALELRHLVELVCESLSDAQQKQLQLLQRRAVDKCVEWMPYKSSFRYVVHRDLAD